ncbi:hypothetical protein NONI108955_30330 [Nocardia ninae]|uniref:hypothetical protein n=1 Tax=Nocardia ninae TaxID=356145 RepID=UPI0011BE8E07|nr:hypothetical protein [Nocardia ninae]
MVPVAEPGGGSERGVLGRQGPVGGCGSLTLDGSTSGVVAVVTGVVVVVVTGMVAVVVAGDGVVVGTGVVVVVTGGVVVVAIDVVAVGAAVVDWMRAGAHVPVVPAIEIAVFMPGPAVATPTANPAMPSSAATIRAMTVACRTEHRRTMPFRVGFPGISVISVAGTRAAQLFS